MLADNVSKMLSCPSTFDAISLSNIVSVVFLYKFSGCGHDNNICALTRKQAFAAGLKRSCCVPTKPMSAVYTDIIVTSERQSVLC